MANLNSLGFKSEAPEEVNRQNDITRKRMLAALTGLEQEAAQTEMAKERMRLQAANDPMEADFDAANEPMSSDGYESSGSQTTQAKPKTNPVNAADPDDQNKPASPYMTAANEPMNQDNLMKGDLPSSIIVDDEKDKKPKEATPEQQDQIAVIQQQAIQNAQATQKLEEEIARGKTASIKGQLMSGGMARVMKMIPGVAGLLSKFEKASLGTMIKLLETLKRTLVGAKKTMGIGEGLVKYFEVMAATAVETLFIVPIIMLLVFPLYITFLFFFPEMFSVIAKKIDTMLKEIDKFLNAVKKMESQQRQKKETQIRLENMKNAQLEVASRSANEPMQTTTSKAA